jgi:hypothetical protein
MYHFEVRIYHVRDELQGHAEYNHHAGGEVKRVASVKTTQHLLPADRVPAHTDILAVAYVLWEGIAQKVDRPLF